MGHERQIAADRLSCPFRGQNRTRIRNAARSYVVVRLLGGWGARLTR